MVFLLGINFPERQLVKKALISLYGISSTSKACNVRAPSNPHFTLATTPAITPAAASPSPAPAWQTTKPSPARLALLPTLLARHHIHPTATLGSLSAATLTALAASLSSPQLRIENDLRRKVRADIARLQDMGSYRGRRHQQGLPVRGQRTRTQITTARKLNRIERRG